MRIRAHAIREKGGRAEPFFYERDLGGRDVLVRITHCSVARGDIQFINDDWGDARFPLVPGHEIVGVVEEVGYGRGRPAARRSCGHRLPAGGLLRVHLLPPGHRAAVPQPEGHRRRQVRRLRRSHRRRRPVCLPAPGGARLGRVGASALVRPDRLRRDPAGAPDGTVSGGRAGGGRSRPPCDPVPPQDGARRVGSLPLARETGVDRAAGRRLRRHRRPRAPGELPRGLRFHPFDPERAFRSGRMCADAETEGPTLPGGFAGEASWRSAAALLSNSQRTIYGNYIGSRADTSRMLQFAAEHGVAAIVDVMPFSRINEAIDRVRRRDVPMGLVLEHRE